jgi:uncharacterized protein (DUF58 family)
MIRLYKESPMYSINRTSMRARWQRLRNDLTLAGRLHLTRRWVLLPGPLILVLALVIPYNGLFFVGYAYLLLMVAAYLWVRVVGPGVRLRRRMRTEWAQDGDELEEQWELTNAAPLPLLWLEIEDASTLPDYSGRRVAAVRAREHISWLTNAVCTRRGVYSLGPLTMRLGDPFGFFLFHWRDTEVRQLVIFPPLVRLPAFELPQGQRGGLARADLLQQYVTPSVGGLREYVPGDLPSRIHWPTVAKTQRLMVKEFDQERAGALWIALDLYAMAYTSAANDDREAAAGERRMPDREAYTQTSVVKPHLEGSGMESPLELAITVASSLAAQALAEGRAVGLLADDGRRRLVAPGQGPRQLWRILSELVDAKAEGELPFVDVLRQGNAARASEAAGAALVVVTPSLDGSWLPGLAVWQRGRPGSVLALLVANRALEAQALEARLAASGVPTHIFEVGTALPLLNPPKPRATMRVSPLGKIVRGD